MAWCLVPKYTAAILLKAPTVSDDEHGISVLVPSLLLMKTRMSTTEAVALEDEVEVLFFPWVPRFFSIRDPSTVEADLLPLFRVLGD